MAGMPDQQSQMPVLASLRCGDDLWLVSRTIDAAKVWTSLKNLYTDCGLVFNFEDSGSVVLGGSAAEEAVAPELNQRPCWSLLQLTPDCSWKVAEWRLAPRVKRALAEVEASDLAMLHRIRIFNRHMDALLRQGGFHEGLREHIQQLHISISSLFRKSIEQATNGGGHNATEASANSSVEPPATSETEGLSKLLSTLLWWPRESGGLGARHLAIALHGKDNRFRPLLPVSLKTADPYETYVRTALQSTMPRNDRYDSHLRALLGPQVQELFGTVAVLA